MDDTRFVSQDTNQLQRKRGVDQNLYLFKNKNYLIISQRENKFPCEYLVSY